MRAFQISPIEPLLLRDGRPFSTDEGALDATSLSLPMPGTLAGFLRTLIGQLRGCSWTTPDDVAAVRGIRVAGPLLLKNETVCFPAPADAVVLDGEEKRLMTLRPFEPQKGGCDLPPGLLPLKATEDGKPAPGYVYWTARDMFLWLANNTPADFLPEDIGDFPRETRLHVAIDPNTLMAKEGMLYSTQMVAYERLRDNGKECESWSFLVAAEVPQEENLCTVHTLGGERRLAAITDAPKKWPDTCTNPIKEALRQTRQVRMVLATPAIFKDGWRPGWLNDELVGSPPGACDIVLRLKGAAVKRRLAVSGWEYRHQRSKQVRWLVPAGSVYFFNVEQGDPKTLGEKLWLKPVSDKERDQNDGYGLALWGAWNDED
ncbi:MAG TPA: type III-B CRISPR module-associated protein Cmr3 [Chthonomonas sp.]|uniref:type III-B CRISPR module-associated protein Cmr3 n=1 Tax=Chthonomonas sp. TaxID=2282153 RepID=UPI002B4AC1E2|nr:type III-B CRISPR module-associated protein Cmr3 [Chthonomonas sp.]HLI49724.1 type III-B CRISPR module-associated protein Cmr3 [Chthonomonas sp.]